MRTTVASSRIETLVPDLTPAQRSRIASVSREAFERLRLDRRELLHELRAQGWSLREMAEAIGVKHPLIVQWMK